MVRLKVKEGVKKFGEAFAFQFHYGTIKRPRPAVFPLANTNFNSTMVRLKDCKFNPFVIVHLFQFHYGTIKSKPSTFTAGASLIFQFHYGTIKRKSV